MENKFEFPALKDEETAQATTISKISDKNRSLIRSSKETKNFLYITIYEVRSH